MAQPLGQRQSGIPGRAYSFGSTRPSGLADKGIVPLLAQPEQGPAGTSARGAGPGQQRPSSPGQPMSTGRRRRPAGTDPLELRRRA